MNIGDTFSKDVDNIVFGRIETQAARQVMMQKVREAERDTIVAMFKSQDNSLMNGTVKRVTRIILSLILEMTLKQFFLEINYCQVRYTKLMTG